MGHEEIQDKYQIMGNFLEALTLRNSIPIAWRRQISANFQEEISLKHIFYINHKRFDLLSSSPRQWYSVWVGALGRPFSRADSWEAELSPSASSFGPDWSATFLLPYKTTRETKLQSFAY